MPRKRKPTPGPPCWLGREAFAALLEITPGAFDKSWRPHAGRVEHIGKRVWYHVRDLIDNRIAFAEERAATRSGDGMCAPAGMSAALERFRAAKAGREEIKLALEKRDVVNREEMRQLLLRDLRALRDGLETLRRNWPEAFTVMDEALMEAQRGIEESLQ